MRFNIDKLQVLAKSLKKIDDGKFKIQVGVFGDKNERPLDKNAGSTNAEIGFKQEMGSVNERIPRRSFLWDTFTKHGVELEQKIKEKKLIEKYFLKGKVDEYLKKVGAAATNLVVKAFMTSGWGEWRPNAPMTIALKGSDKPLIDKGELWQSITSRVVKA